MNELKIGWAMRDVSTTQPVTIPGQFYLRISQGVLDPVTVTALVIENGVEGVVFLSADLVVIRGALLDKIRDRVAALCPNLPLTKILMHATHTHTGPSAYGGDLPWEVASSTPPLEEVPDAGLPIASAAEYQRFFVNQAAEAVAEAYTKRSAGGMAYGYGYAVTGHCRRVVYFDDLSRRTGAVVNATAGVSGHAAMYGNTNDPMFSHYEAGADHLVNLLYTFDADRRLTGAIVNVACPAQSSEHEWRLSSSFWHETRKAIRAQHGDLFLLPQCAASGDVSPRLLHYRKAQERRFQLKYGAETLMQVSEAGPRRDIAEQIAAVFTEVLGWARKDIQRDLPLRHIVSTVLLSRRRVTPEEYEAARTELERLTAQPFKTDGTPLEQLRHNSMLVAARNRCRRLLERYATQEAHPKLPMEMHVVRLGDVAFVSNRFELFTDYMHRIQARSPFVQTFVVQLAGVPGPDGGTYLATERAVWGRGYSASPYCNLVSPQGGQELVEETLRLLNQLAAEAPPVAVA